MARHYPVILAALLLCCPATSLAEGDKIGDQMGSWLMRSGYCGDYVPTALRTQIGGAKAAVVGTVTNARKSDLWEDLYLSSDLKVQVILKDDPILKGSKEIHLPEVPFSDPKIPPRILVLCGEVKGRVDAEQCLWIKSDSMLNYLQQAVALDPKKPDASLLFLLRHLDSPDRAVAEEAYIDLLNTPYTNLRSLAARLPVEAITARLTKKPSSFTLPLDAFLLGHCGNDRHAALLAKKLGEENAEKHEDHVRALLIGYTLLKPLAGFALLRGILGDNRKPYWDRDCALQALRFFWDTRPDVIPRARLVEAASLPLAQADIAHHAIEELRRHGEKQFLDRVLALNAQPKFDNGAMRDAVLKFALAFKKEPEAARFLERLPAADRERVELLEFVLKEEAQAHK